MMLANICRVIFFIAICLATSASTCLQPKNPGTPGADGGVVDAAPPTFSSCTSQTIRDIANSIQGDIASALINNTWEAELGALAAKFTVDEVKCAIQIWLGGHARMAQADAMMRLQVSRANTWLNKN